MAGRCRAIDRPAASMNRHLGDAWSYAMQTSAFGNAAALVGRLLLAAIFVQCVWH
jgi:hypothetical protein